MTLRREQAAIGIRGAAPPARNGTGIALARRSAAGWRQGDKWQQRDAHRGISGGGASRAAWQK